MKNLHDDRHLTNWYASSTKPTRVGVYRCLYRNAEGKFQEFYSTWTGTYWTPVSESLDNLRPTRKRAKRQAIRWRGLTEPGYELMNSMIEAARLEEVAKNNLILLQEIRASEKKRLTELAEAEGFYLTLLARCDEDRQLAAEVRKQLKTADLASLRPSLNGGDYAEYIDIPNGTPDDSNTSLREALKAAKGSVRYWETYWHDASAELMSKLGNNNDKYEVGSVGLVVNHAEHLHKFSHGVSAKSAHGNVGSKR